MANSHSTHVVTAVFRHQNDAMRAYEWLRQHGYGLEEISVLVPGRKKNDFHQREHDDVMEQKTHAAAGAQQRGLIGAVIGALLLALAVLAIMLILATQEMLGSHSWPASLAAIGAGSMFGALLGGLLGYGFPDRSARVYEPILEQGGIAIGVKPHTRIDELVIASEFQELHGEKILSH